MARLKCAASVVNKRALSVGASASHGCKSILGANHEIQPQIPTKKLPCSHGQSSSFLDGFCNSCLSNPLQVSAQTASLYVGALGTSTIQDMAQTTFAFDFYYEPALNFAITHSYLSGISKWSIPLSPPPETRTGYFGAIRFAKDFNFRKSSMKFKTWFVSISVYDYYSAGGN